MSSSIRKIIKCVIAFSFIFTVVGCGSSKEKTNKETAEVIKNDKELQSEVSLFTSEPYSCISIKGDEYHKKGIFIYRHFKILPVFPNFLYFYFVSIFFSALFPQTAGRAAFFSRNYITLYIWNIAI